MERRGWRRGEITVVAVGGGLPGVFSVASALFVVIGEQGGDGPFSSILSFGFSG